MPNRLPLKNQLLNAWQKTIEGAYQEPSINSEHGLQFHFLKKLEEYFKVDSTSRKVFIEPKVIAGKLLYPDVVICNSRQIIGVVELKYLPRARPKFQKDIETLSQIAQNSQQVTVACHRYLGNRSNEKNYTLAKDAVLCWAGVYTGSTVEIERPSEISQKQFLLLHARTQENAPPKIESNFVPRKGT